MIHHTDIGEAYTSGDSNPILISEDENIEFAGVIDVGERDGTVVFRVFESTKDRENPYTYWADSTQISKVFDKVLNV